MLLYTSFAFDKYPVKTKLGGGHFLFFEKLHGQKRVKVSFHPLGLKLFIITFGSSNLLAWERLQTESCEKRQNSGKEQSRQLDPHREGRKGEQPYLFIDFKKFRGVKKPSTKNI